MSEKRAVIFKLLPEHSGNIRRDKCVLVKKKKKKKIHNACEFLGTVFWGLVE